MSAECPKTQYNLIFFFFFFSPGGKSQTGSGQYLHATARPAYIIYLNKFNLA